MLTKIAPVLYAVAAVAPFKGRLVKIPGKGGSIVGRVFYHGRDRYSHAFRYGDDAAMHLIECAGRSGYRIGVESDAGKVFAKAGDAIVCLETTPEDHQ